MDELISAVPRYKRLRSVGVPLCQRVVSSFGKSELQQGASRLDMLEGRTIVLNSEDESTVLMDFCMHDVWIDGRNAVGRFLETSPPPPDSDEMRILEGWRASRHSLFIVERVEHGAGVHLRDLLHGGSIPLVDINLSRSALPNGAIAMRVCPFDGIWMSTGAGLPADAGIITRVFDGLSKMLPNGPPLSELAAERRSEATALIIRACLAAGASSRIRYANLANTRGRDGGRAGTSPPLTRDILAPGRNDPCPCGSGKKYKKCCGR